MALNEAKVAQIRRAGEHFKKVLRETFELFPRSATTIAGLTRWTQVNKSTCQRIVQALNKSKDGIQVIITLPGISGLEQISQAANKLLNGDPKLKPFHDLIGEYQDLIFEFATSQSELKRQLLQYQNRNSQSLDTYAKKLKKQAYEVNREISGESVDTYIGIHYFSINTEDPQFIDELILGQKVGIELSKFARPFVQNFGGNSNELKISDPVSIGKNESGKFDKNENGEYLLTDFSTKNINASYAGIGNLKNSLIYNHNVEPIDGKAFDITLAHYDRKTQLNPLVDNHKTICQSIVQRSPAKRLILIALLDKKLDKNSEVIGGCYPTSIKAHEKDHQPEDLWSERFSDAPEIKLFDPNDKNLAEKLKIDDLDGLIKEGFQMLDEQPNHYSGYLIDVEYPLWLTSHRFYFRF